MKLTSFLHADRESYGLWEGDVVRDLGAVLGGRYLALRDLLAADAFADAAEAASSAPKLEPAKLRLLPVIPRPGKILCVGTNYADHVSESSLEVPKHPLLFTRFPDSLVGHDQPMLVPRESHRFDFEGELAIIIGKGGRRIGPEDAMSAIAGYTCFNDGSVRDWQLHTSQFTAGKNFTASGAFGPWMVTADEIADPASMVLTTRLNGEEVQRASVGEMIHNIPAIIAYCSAFTTLEPGDVIATGTPAGVGMFRKPRLWMKPGDIVEVEVSSVGVLRNSVAQD